MPCTEPGAKDVVINDIDMIPIMKVLNFTDGRDNSSMNSETGRRLSETKTQMEKCLEIIQVF